MSLRIALNATTTKFAEGGLSPFDLQIPRNNDRGAPVILLMDTTTTIAYGHQRHHSNYKRRGAIAISCTQHRAGHDALKTTRDSAA